MEQNINHADLPYALDGKEKFEFEKWAARKGFPMDLQFMRTDYEDPRTLSARDGWIAALEYVQRKMGIFSIK